MTGVGLEKNGSNLGWTLAKGELVIACPFTFEKGEIILDWVFGLEKCDLDCSFGLVNWEFSLCLFGLVIRESSLDLRCC